MRAYALNYLDRKETHKKLITLYFSGFDHLEGELYVAAGGPTETARPTVWHRRVVRVVDLQETRYQLGAQLVARRRIVRHYPPDLTQSTGTRS
jgi:hypothetical protein